MTHFKNFKRLVIVFGLTLGLSGVAHAVDFSQNALVDVLTAIGLTNDTQMDFGVVSDNDGTITLSTADAISVDASGIAAGGVPLSADFTVTGAANDTVQITFTGSNANGLQILNFVTSPANVSALALGVGGSTTFIVGADLTVTAASASTGTNTNVAYTVHIIYP